MNNVPGCFELALLCLNQIFKIYVFIYILYGNWQFLSQVYVYHCA